MRVCLFSERLDQPYDEGIKNLAVNLVAGLRARHEVLAVTSGGTLDVDRDIENIDAGRLLLSVALRRAIRDFRPQAIVYVPTSSSTTFGLARARVLRGYGGGVPTALVALQPRRHSLLGGLVVRALAPDCVFTQAVRSRDALRALGCRSELLPPAVDSSRFRPASGAERAARRAQYGIAQAAYVVTHVGHLKRSRHLDGFLELAACPWAHGLVVASTSTPQDAEIKERLLAAGVTVLDTFVPHIEEVYQLSDLYVFLAEHTEAAIELPLSVLEAMACNLAVVGTPFGGLPDFFPGGQGLTYWREQPGLLDVIETVRHEPVATRKLVADLTWQAAAEGLLRTLMPDEAVT